MYRIQIDEIQNDKLVRLYDRNMEQGILKTGDTVGMFGFSNPTEIIYQLKEFAENLAIKIMGVDEDDDLDEEKILAVVITECIIGINIAALAIGPISEMDVLENKDKSRKLKQHAFELLDKGKEIVSLCDNLKVSTLYDYRQKLGELLMEELDSIDKDKD